MDLELTDSTTKRQNAIAKHTARVAMDEEQRADIQEEMMFPLV